MVSPNKLFTIQEVSEQLELPKHTLRFYEKEFNGMLVPIRTKGGQRRYSLENIFVLKQIITQKKEGKSLSEIRDVINIKLGAKSITLDDAAVDFLVSRVVKLVKAELYEFMERYETEKIRKIDQSE